ncbi:MAG: alpha-glucosidase/alpha-galactosidase [Clostridia bacterium]|nr:alpha-glucosidase/alpha-galactosidase [Clostridia bacterium]
MNYTKNGVENLKIAYIGGGSKGWAWTLMSDLATAEDLSGQVALYDIDFKAAKDNEIIGKKYASHEKSKSKFDYKACETIDEALAGADFVIISILPATLDEMYSDVHAPEKYGIYQSVGDTTGPGGIIRALRTLPMIEYIAKKIEEHCPGAWVINYTNPMTVITATLYRVFPKIKAFGCCHEVFGTQKLLASMLRTEYGYDKIRLQEIKCNVMGVNHFTWLTEAKYKNIDLFPLYKEFANKYYETGYNEESNDNWMNTDLMCGHRVKFELFRRYGYIAAAGDRHLAEFCEGSWFLKNPEQVKDWKFTLTTVDSRRKGYQDRFDQSAKLISGEIEPEIGDTGEEGVQQMRSLLGLTEMVTNVNIPNYGQIPNLPLGAVVETNARFTSNTLTPIFTGNLPIEIYPLITRIVAEQELVIEAALERNLEKAFVAFMNNPLINLSKKDARALFDEMVENTKEYLKEYF